MPASSLLRFGLCLLALAVQAIPWHGTFAQRLETGRYPREPMGVSGAQVDRPVQTAQLATPSEVWQRAPRGGTRNIPPAANPLQGTVTAPPLPLNSTILPSVTPTAPATSLDLPPLQAVGPVINPADVIIDVNETQTQQLLFGLGFGSEAGVNGQFIFEERSFDLTAFPWRVGWRNAFRGGGQRLRIEAVPGNEVQRYLASFTEPNIFGSETSFNISGFFFDRAYDDWDQQEYGGRFGLGRPLNERLSVGFALRAEQIEITNPTVLGVPELDRVLGKNNVYSGKVMLTYDNRDFPYWTSAGSFLELAFEQGFGDFDYPRGTVDYRRYFQVYERADGTGRRVVSQIIRTGIAGSGTPIFDNFFAGGHSTLRGFRFRGASPVDQTVIVGGEFQLLGSTEYIFPITADDMLRGVFFADYGTVEEEIDIDFNDFRVAVGVGLRVSVPALGMGAPIAVDFALPLNRADTDREQSFSFYLGIGR